MHTIIVQSFIFPSLFRLYTVKAEYITFITFNRWRIQGGEFRAVGPQRPKVACLPPPLPTVDRCEFFLQLKMFFYRYEYFRKSLALLDSLFLAFCEVQNFKVFFGISKSFRNWILTHPRSTKNQVSYIKRRTFIFYTKNINFRHFLDDFGGRGLFVCWGLRALRRPRQFASPGRWKVRHFVIYIFFRK